MKTTSGFPNAKAKLLSLACAFGAVAGTVGAAEMILAENGMSRAPIMVAADASPATKRAAMEMAAYFEKVSGAKATLGAPGSQPPGAGAIWVGHHALLKARFPDVDFDLKNPEEVLIACNGHDLVVAGRDRMVGEIQTEYGTANAVYTFLQKYLGVRWLWPGPLGEDIVRQDRVTFPPFVYRFHPIFRQRKIYRPNYLSAEPGQGPGAPELDRLMRQKQQVATDWYRLQRAYLDSYDMAGGHAFATWWADYHEKHPEYFALRPDGTRNADPKPDRVKLCVSNPGMLARWLDNAEQELRNRPARIMVSASPNDGNAANCGCETCRSWDAPEAPNALTDRHVKSWNILARELRKRFPGREVYVGAWGYNVNRTPPVREVLEKNLVIGFVSGFPFLGEKQRAADKLLWKGWAEKASNLVYRPNLFHYSGGELALSAVAMRRTIEDFRFLAENRCVGLNIDSIPEHWAAEGVEYYLIAQLAWDPLQDANAVLTDYYRRGFSGAAQDVKKYFELMEQVQYSVLERTRPAIGRFIERNDIFKEIYTPEILSQADGFLRDAAKQVAGGPEVYGKRVAFLQVGLDLTKLQIEILRVMDQVRESGGRATAAVKRAVELCDRREKLLQENLEGFAVGYTQLIRATARTAGGRDDYQGPPSAAFLKAAGLK